AGEQGAPGLGWALGVECRDLRGLTGPPAERFGQLETARAVAADLGDLPAEMFLLGKLLQTGAAFQPSERIGELVRQYEEVSRRRAAAWRGRWQCRLADPPPASL